MILANWLRRASEEPHSSTAPSRLVEGLFLLWSVSMSSDVPYRRPQRRASMVVHLEANGLEPRFSVLISRERDLQPLHEEPEPKEKAPDFHDQNTSSDRLR